MVHLPRQAPGTETEHREDQRDRRENGDDAANPTLKPRDWRSQHEREQDGDCKRHEHGLCPVEDDNHEHTPANVTHGFKVLSVSSIRPHRSSRVQRPSLDRRAGVHVVCRRGLLSIEGFAVGGGLDPDRCPQRVAPPAVNRRSRDLIREVPNPLESGVSVSIASDGGVALHGVSLPIDGHPVLFYRARTAPAYLAPFSDEDSSH